MNRMRFRAVVIALALALTAGHSAIGAAQDRGAASSPEISLLGGFQILNENDTALPDRFVNIPAVAAVSWWLTPVFVAEGEFSWLIPLERSVGVGGAEQDRKTPDVLAYQANLRAHLPGSAPWSPYLAAGLGALTVLSNTDADRLPQVDETQTMFALNFGAGLRYALNSRWALRADFREFVAFPSDDASGLSDATGADPIRMERGAVGLGYRF